MTPPSEFWHYANICFRRRNQLLALKEHWLHATSRLLEEYYQQNLLHLEARFKLGSKDLYDLEGIYIYNYIM